MNQKEREFCREYFPIVSLDNVFRCRIRAITGTGRQDESTCPIQRFLSKFSLSGLRQAAKGSEPTEPKKLGHTPLGVQRYHCKTWGKTFTETKGTLFFHKHAPMEQILEVLALLAEGNRIATLTRVKGIKEDTILRWLREAAQHTDELNEVLMHDFHLKRAQIAGLWSFVQHKGEKQAIPKPRTAAPSGSQP